MQVCVSVFVYVCVCVEVYFLCVCVCVCVLGETEREICKGRKKKIKGHDERKMKKKLPIK